MRSRVWMAAGALVMALTGAALWAMLAPRALSKAALAAHYAAPLTPPDRAVSVFHLGHSLVGRDMPAILAQLAGHAHASQLGWGASLQGHWTGDIPGFAEENAHAAFRPALQSVDSGDYPVVVLTEMVELRDAIRSFDSPHHLALWARRIRDARPDARIYLYETWHRLDDLRGFLTRIDEDRVTLWEGTLLARAMAQEGVGTIHVIPGGQVMAATVRAIEMGAVPGLAQREDLFGQNPDGSPDPIHFNEIGAYLMAITHYAVIYHRSPVGLPHALARSDGARGTPMAAETAAALQKIAWDVVKGYAATGVASD